MVCKWISTVIPQDKPEPLEALRKKVQILRNQKDHKTEVNPQLRRLGEMERAHDQNMSYQAFPLAYVNVLGQNTFVQFVGKTPLST
ncbi:hypothetical protein Hdeb2414_s0066g00767471 [Helianthus debilis subsp. tardiflorus]